MGELGLVEPYATLTLKDGRKLGYLDVGAASGHAVFHFHGHGSSRLEALMLEDAANRLGLRVIALDRPGIGYSDPKDVATGCSTLAGRRRPGWQTSSRASNALRCRACRPAGAYAAGLCASARGACHRLFAGQRRAAGDRTAYRAARPPPLAWWVARIAIRNICAAA